MSRYRLIQGDCLEVMRGMESGSVHCCVTSPPYFNLRDYQMPGQLGLESLHDCAGWATGQKCGGCYICKLTAVFSEVRRVLRDDGTAWVNIGDSFVGGGGFAPTAPSNNHTKSGQRGKDCYGVGMGVKAKNGLKPKDLCLIPQRLALSLQADGWYIRQDIVWAKTAPMPESVKDRCTKAHEYVWLLSKSPKYYFDAAAISEPCGGFNGSSFTKGKTLAAARRVGMGERVEPEKRNKRSWWPIAGAGCPEAHFAVMPEELIEPCVLAGCPVGGLVFDPFTGSGQVGRVALRLNRRFVGAELNPEYIALAHRRIGAVACQEKLPLFGGDE